MKSIIPLLALTAFLTGASALPAAEVPEGQPAPKAGMKLLKDGAVSDFPGWAAYKGKIVVLEFWSTDCAPCVASLPHLNELQEKLAGKPVAFVPVTFEKEKPVRAFLKTHPIAGAVGVDGIAAWRAFGVKAMPQAVLIGKGGKVLRYTQLEELNETNLARLADTGSADGIKKIMSTREAVRPKAPDTRALFEVLVSTPAQGDNSSFNLRTDGGDVTYDYKAVSFRPLVALLYEVGEDRVLLSSAAPQQNYNFSVRVPEKSALHVKALLQEAVKAAYNVEIKPVALEREALILRLDNGPSGLKPAGSAHSMDYYGNGYYRSKGVRPARFAFFLEMLLGKPVIDETGLKGRYDFDLAWDQAVPGALEAAAGKAGFKLVPENRSVEMLQIVPAAQGEDAAD